MTYRIFLSHYSGDRAIADVVSELIDRTFAGHVEPFISSAIPIGKNWLTEVKDALVLSDEILTIFTHRAAERPWVNKDAPSAVHIIARTVLDGVALEGFSSRS